MCEHKPCIYFARLYFCCKFHWHIFAYRCVCEFSPSCLLAMTTLFATCFLSKRLTAKNAFPLSFVLPWERRRRRNSGCMNSSHRQRQHGERTRHILIPRRRSFSR